MVVLIPNGGKDYHGIGIVEVMWKVVAAILNRRIAAPSSSVTSSMDFGWVVARVPLPQGC